MAGLVKESFVDTDGETRWFNQPTRTLYMPYNIDVEDYGDISKELVNKGYFVQLEII